jgi:hypothetical protein
MPAYTASLNYFKSLGFPTIVFAKYFFAHNEEAQDEEENIRENIEEILQETTDEHASVFKDTWSTEIRKQLKVYKKNQQLEKKEKQRKEAENISKQMIIDGLFKKKEMEKKVADMSEDTATIVPQVDDAGLSQETLQEITDMINGTVHKPTTSDDTTDTNCTDKNIEGDTPLDADVNMFINNMKFGGEQSKATPVHQQCTLCGKHNKYTDKQICDLVDENNFLRNELNKLKLGKTTHKLVTLASKKKVQ